MRHMKLKIPVKGIHQAFVAGQRLKSDGRNKMRGVLRHDHMYICMQFYQMAGQHCHFISCNTAGYA